MNKNEHEEAVEAGIFSNNTYEVTYPHIRYYENDTEQYNEINIFNSNELEKITNSKMWSSIRKKYIKNWYENPQNVYKLILVRNSEDEEWVPRTFVGVYYYDSKIIFITRDNEDREDWNYARLINKEDLATPYINFKKIINELNKPLIFMNEDEINEAMKVGALIIQINRYMKFPCIVYKPTELSEKYIYNDKSQFSKKENLELIKESIFWEDFYNSAYEWYENPYNIGKIIKYNISGISEPIIFKVQKVLFIDHYSFIEENELAK